MARKGRGRAINRRKSSKGGGKALVALAVVAVLIVGGYFLLQKSRKPAPQPKSKPAQVTTERQPLPPRVPVQAQVSSVSPTAPAAKPASVAKPETPVVPQAKGPGRVAIVIDDMGTNLQELQALMSIKLPLTFSVIPSLAHAKGVAEAAHGAGYQVMIHMPMEPEGYPKQRMESIGLLLSMDDQEISDRVNGYFRTVPYAIGANNHMGSRFTQDAGKMEVALKVLQEKGVFFIDSRTAPKSAGYRVARTLGMKCAERQVFLDNVQDEAAIRKQLMQAAGIARKRGAAIAICHPHQATIRTLKSAMPELAKSGITFVYVSTLVK
ncbi:divergent polysaccharide deacetylase family protein [Geomonas sp.]|uniref:divergent polysaccharide deacetylase family protein n=1 Tax=Geomonas sp. TaxID=2651584 RepID=UPI002B483794|nr:divergent polysaccharide deacetylase family protein [Geomonas sp.]HJV36527.1 divergent polysaccharide deacetylase family protein [Geomonas sp.]